MYKKLGVFSFSLMCDDGHCVNTFDVGDGLRECINDETPEWSSKDRVDNS